MKLVIFPNTPDKQVFVVSGKSATFGSAADNAMCLNFPGLSDYQGSLSYHEGVWLFETLDEKPFLVGEESTTSLKLKVGLKFTFAGINFLVLDVTVTEEPQAAPAPSSDNQVLPPLVQGGAVATIPGAGPQGYQIAPGGQQWAPAMGGQFVNPWDAYVVQTSDTLAKLGLIFAILGPILLGIGEFLGLILSLVSLSRRRNTARGNIMAWTGVIVSLIWFVGIGLTTWHFATRDVLKHNEARVVARLEKAALSEYYIKYALLVDDDENLDGEFVPLERFANVQGLDERVKELGESPKRDGYNYYSENVGADTFVITAVPQVYGVTGKQTFFVNEEGYVVSEDLKGSRFTGNPLAGRSDLEAQKSIVDRYEKELSDKLLFAAELAFKNKNFDACQHILENLRAHFPYSPAMARLTSIEKENAPFLIEAKALRLYSDAKNYLDKQQGDAALATMRKVVSEYPESSLAKEVQEKINEVALKLAKEELANAYAFLETNQWSAVEDTLQRLVEKYPEALPQSDLRLEIENCRKLRNNRRNEFAEALLKKAERLELEGETLEAYNTYLQLKDNYADTTSAKGIDNSLSRLSGLLDEKTAKGYIAEIMHNVALSNETVVINMINLLKNACGNTLEYKRSAENLEKIRKNCVVNILSREADEFFRQGNARAALARMEQIIAEKPEMIVTLKDKYESALVSCFNLAYEAETYDEALEYYERYVALSPEVNLIPRDKADQCYFNRGLHLFQTGDLAGAISHLEKCSAAFSQQPDFNYLCGRINAALGRWQAAVRYLLASDGLDNSYKFDMWATRAYAIWKISPSVEGNLVGTVCRQAHFMKNIKEYKLMVINYVKRTTTNTLENVGNTRIKIDKASVTGDILVSLERDDNSLVDDPTHTTNEHLYFRDLVHQVDGQIRAAARALDSYNKSSKSNAKMEVKTQLDEQLAKIESINEALKVVDKREKLSNQQVLKCLNQSIVYYKNLGGDLGNLLRNRTLPLVKSQFSVVALKYENLNQAKKEFLNFTKKRDHRYQEVLKQISDVVVAMRRGSLTVSQAEDISNTLSSIYHDNEDSPLEFLNKLIVALRVVIDLTPLEEHIPKIQDKDLLPKKLVEEINALGVPSAPAEK